MVSAVAGYPASAASLSSVIGASKAAYATATIGLVLIAVLATAFVFASTSRPGGPRRIVSSVAALIGIALVCLGASQLIAHYKPFDPAATNLELHCVADGGPPNADIANLTISYDASRQCLNGRTFYEARDSGLTRVIAWRTGKGDSAVQEVSSLEFLWDPYRSRPMFRLTKVHAYVTSADFAGLAKPALKLARCPSATPADIAEAARRAEAVRTAYSGLTLQSPTTTRWLCSTS